MPSASLLDKLTADYPQFVFQNASVSYWSARAQTVFYHDCETSEGLATLLHELGHAVAGHSSYHKDIELLGCEREAWRHAHQIARTYGITLDPEFVESHIDTYREWLHARSRCPSCLSAGIQLSTLHYSCVLCQTTWTANDARQCGLKRYTKTQTS